jgi:hypothetical protein
LEVQYVATEEIVYRTKSVVLRSAHDPLTIHHFSMATPDVPISRPGVYSFQIWTENRHLADCRVEATEK